MGKEAFVEAVIRAAQTLGYRLEQGRGGLRQIDFGHKKLHEGHLRALYPAILAPGAPIGKIIASVAPGRPCTHKPMRAVIEALTKG